MTSVVKKTAVLIIGSGPAGYTAAIYAARGALRPILVEGFQPGGQLMITTEVENYPGFADAVQGPWLMDQMRRQALHVGAEIVTDMIVSLDLSVRPFRAVDSAGGVYETESVILATGAQAKWLGLPSEDHFKGFGVSGCATCDGVFFKGKRVAVVGGGNTAVEEALYLTKHASHVYLIHRRDALRAEKILQERLFAHSSVTALWHRVVEEVCGREDPRGVTSLRLRDTRSGELETLDVDGVFIAIGHHPTTELVMGQLPLDRDGYIVTTPGSTATSVPGVFAAGDVQDKIYRQAVTAAGTGCMAALEAQKFLDHEGKQ